MNWIGGGLSEYFVAIVEDEADVRNTLAHLLGSAGLRTVEYESAEQLLADTEATRFNCLILDINLRGMSGLQLQARLRRHGADLPIVIISGGATAADAIQAYRQQASAMFEKPFNHGEFVATVKDLTASWTAKQAKRQEIEARLAALSPRERDVMDSLVAGKKTIQIAQELSISSSTVEKHRLRVFEKTGADSVVSLIHWLADLN
jgi:two-component system response regulator DctR